MKFLYKEKEFMIDGYLASALDSLVYNLNSDWDFVVLVTGDRGVRVGKSVLAMTVCAYLATKLAENKLNKDAYGLDNIFFDNKLMIDQAQLMPKYSVVHYDEGREGLAANKAMKQFQQDLMDFFAECGQLNHIFVICCPDFFELKESIAVARSEYLINVYRKEVAIHTKYHGDVVRLDRGQFEFFNRSKKRLLFDLARSTRKRVYSLTKANFIGTFANQYPEDEEQYKQKKTDSLARFKERHKEEIKKDPVKENLSQALITIKELYPEVNLSKVSEMIGKGEDYLTNTTHRIVVPNKEIDVVPKKLGTTTPQTIDYTTILTENKENGVKPT